MYNDENNYHYTYEKGGDQPGQRYDARSGGEPAPHCQSYSYYQPPVQEMKPAKTKKKRTGLKIAALALVCALLGGAVGGGVAWGMAKGSIGTSEVAVTARPATEVVVKTVDGQTAMSDAEVYAVGVNTAVSINVTGTAGTNFFGQPVQTASSGSGFVLTENGYIVTNYHVVESAETVKVTMYNGDEYEAKYVGGDEDYDIAVIKVEAEGLQAVTLGDSDTLNVGDHVLAIGNPLGELTFSMSGGMVSSVNRAINVDGTPFNMIQTDASINSGNSGGPLFNQYGEVVGIVSAKYSSSGSGASVEGLGFAIPINDVFAMIQDIMTNGYITNKPYLAITGGTMTEQMAAQYRYDITSGVFVYSVEEGGAAQKAGLKMGDVIVKIDGHAITSMEDMTVVKKQYAAGDTCTVTFYREGAETTAELTWDAVPADQQTADETVPQQQPSSGNQYGGGYSNPFDMFDYFFGNRYGGW
ncbi:MAG: trypsin-like peptidase domain-containing protein [Oscillibacter sp.]|nr:trypsin-like peptidase domain-containing protein [Oscillibacter sp.]